MENHNESHQHQNIIVPYETVQKLYQSSAWDYKHVSPMELQRLMWSTKAEHLKLTVSERATFSVLLNHVNLDKAKREGCYEAYPSVDSIIALTGSSDRAIRGYIKCLRETDWVKVISGRGSGQNNHYYINAPKIVSCYKLSNPEDQKPYRTGKAFEAIESVPFLIRRNTSGLKRGRSASMRGRGLAH